MKEKTVKIVTTLPLIQLIIIFVLFRKVLVNEEMFNLLQVSVMVKGVIQ